MSIECIFLYFQEVSYDKLLEFFRGLDFLSVFWYKVNSRFTVSSKFATSLKETDWLGGFGYSIVRKYR